MKSQSTYALFEKLVELCAQAPECLSRLTEVAKDPESYRVTFAILKEHLPKQIKGAPSDAVDQKLPNDAAQSLYHQIATSEYLLRLFQDQPQLDEAAPEHVVILAEFADIRPDEETILFTQDGAFSRVMERLRTLEKSDPTEALINEDFTRLADLHKAFPQMIEPLGRIADSGKWSSRMRKVEFLLTKPEEQKQGFDELGDETKALLVLVNQLPLSEKTKCSETLLQQPRLSTVLDRAVLAFRTVAPNLPAKADQIFALIPEEEKESIRLNWGLRIEVGGAALRLRRSVKFDALEHGWPELSRLLQREPASLNSLEAHVIRPELNPPPTQKWLSSYVSNNALARLLRLQPWLKYTDSDVIVKAAKNAQASLQTTAAQVAQTAQSAVETHIPAESVAPTRPVETRLPRQKSRWRPTTLGHPEKTLAPDSVSPEGPPSYRDLLLEFRQVAPSPRAEGDTHPDPDFLPKHGLEQLMRQIQSDNPRYEEVNELQRQLRALLEERRQGKSVADESIHELFVKVNALAKDVLGVSLQDLAYQFTYKVMLKNLGETADDMESGVEIDISWRQVDELTARLVRISRADASFRPSEGYAVASRSATTREYGGVETANEIGLQLHKILFQGSVHETLDAALKSEQPLRLFVSAADPMFSRFPVESIYASGVRRFLGLTHNVSVLRYHAPLKVTNPVLRRLEIPVQVLAVLSNPPGTSWLNIRQEEDILRRALAEAQQQGLVQLQILKDQDTTRENLFAAARELRPQVFHFTGHALLDDTKQGSSLVVEDQNRQPTTIDSTDIVTLLAETGIKFVFLNGCQTGTPSSNDAFTGLAQALLGAGMWGVIATLRPVYDQTALLFAREFYRSFVEGYAVEGAVIEARKALSLARMDWSAYALFTSLTDLSGLRFGRPASQTR